MLGYGLRSINTGVINQNINVPALLPDGRKGCLKTIHLGHIDGVYRTSRNCWPKLFQKTLKIDFTPAQEYQVGTASGQTQGNSPAYTSAGSSYQGCLSRQSLS
jgi:hypothetical protein